MKYMILRKSFTKGYLLKLNGLMIGSHRLKVRHYAKKGITILSQTTELYINQTGRSHS